MIQNNFFSLEVGFVRDWQNKFRQMEIEGKILSVFGLIFIIGLAVGLPMNIPDQASLSFVEKHYFRPLWIAFMLQILLSFFHSRKSTAPNSKKIILLIKIQLFLIASVFIHFNFKAWMPLVHHHLYDTSLHKVDIFLYPIIISFHSIRLFIADRSPINLDFAYHYFFVVFFFISFSAHMLFDSLLHLRQLIVAVCLVLLIGGMSYWILPAEGPFIFHQGLNELSTNSQHWMHLQFQYVYRNGLLPGGYFASPPAAMPSLHVAHTLVFCYFAWRHLKPLFILYAPMATWIVIESVCSGFHYLADLPVGIALGILGIALTEKWLKNP